MREIMFDASVGVSNVYKRYDILEAYDYALALKEDSRNTGTAAGCSGAGTNGNGYSGSRKRYSVTAELSRRECFPYEF